MYHWNRVGKRSARARRAMIAALLVGLCAPREAMADEPREDVTKQAQQLYDEGFSAGKAGNWEKPAQLEKARTFFLSAWRIQQHWLIALQLGRVEVKLGRMRDAAEHLAFALRHAPSLKQDDRALTEEMMARARASVGELTVTGIPPQAEIYVDSERVTTTGPLFVEPGTRRVEARSGGRETVQKVLTVAAGARVEVEFSLPARRPDDGQYDGPEPPKGGSEKAGPDKRLVLAGGVAAWTALGVGFGFLGAFIATGESKPAAGTPEHDACTRDPAGCAHNKRYRAHDAFGSVSVYSFIAAGAIGGTVLAYTLWPRQRTIDVKAAVKAGPGGAGAVLIGQW